jgi:hypothetical protein
MWEQMVTICDQDGLHSEFDFLQWTFWQNGHNDLQIHHAVYPPQEVKAPSEDPSSITFFPFNEISYKCIRRMPSENNKTVGNPPRKISSFLWPVKDDTALKTPGVYSIPCKFAKVYIGQIGWLLKRGFRSTINKFGVLPSGYLPRPNTASTWASVSC